MIKISDFLDIEKETMNPNNYPNNTFYLYSIPGYDIGLGPTKEKGENIKSIKKIIKDNTILISKLNPHILIIWKIKNCDIGSGCSTEFVVLRFIKKEQEDLIDFFYALFNSKRFKDFLISNTNGTSNSHQRVKSERILEFEFESLSYKRMIEIGKIYSILNSKIELNNKIIKKVNEIGDKLFNLYFTNQNYKRDMLKDFIYITKGASYRSVDLRKSENGLVNLKCIRIGGGFNHEGIKEYAGDFKDEQVINQGEIIISNTDLTQNAEVIGRPAIVTPILNLKKMIASLDISILRPSKIIPNSYLYFMLRTTNFQNHIKGYTNGTTVLHLNQKGIQNYMFSLAEKEKIEKYDYLMSPLLKLFQNIEIENQIISMIKNKVIISIFN